MRNNFKYLVKDLQTNFAKTLSGMYNFDFCRHVHCWKIICLLITLYLFNIIEKRSSRCSKKTRQILHKNQTKISKNCCCIDKTTFDIWSLFKRSWRARALLNIAKISHFGCSYLFISLSIRLRESQRFS